MRTQIRMQDITEKMIDDVVEMYKDKSIRVVDILDANQITDAQMYALLDKRGIGRTRSPGSGVKNQKSNTTRQKLPPERKKLEIVSSNGHHAHARVHFTIEECHFLTGISVSDIEFLIYKKHIEFEESPIKGGPLMILLPSLLQRRAGILLNKEKAIELLEKTEVILFKLASCQEFDQTDARFHLAAIQQLLEPLRGANKTLAEELP